MFLSSKALIDYSTSGLENPLTYLLICAFAGEWWRHSKKGGTLLRSSFLAGLIILNRMDMALMIAPAMGILLWRQFSWKAVRQLLLGVLPLIGWELFATLYYGFPFPNTAYAKLGAKVPSDQLLALGTNYFVDSLSRDWVTLPVIGLGAIAALARRNHAPLAAGIALYLSYVTWIGGDFMSGRFFTAPALMAILLLCKMRPGGAIWPLVPLTCLALSLLSPASLLFGGDYKGAPRRKIIGTGGVADERAFFYEGTSLLDALDAGVAPSHRWAQNGRALEEAPPRVRVATAIGMLGFFAGPRVHVLDRLALSDPLLARLPSVYTTRARAGHFRRRIPVGYENSIRTHTNMLENIVLHRFYDKLRLVTRAPLLSWQRLTAIWEVNTAPLPCSELFHLRAPVDVSVELSGNGPIERVEVYAEHSVYISLPQASTELQLNVTNQAACDLVWMRGKIPGEIFRTKKQSVSRLAIPSEANGVLLLREGSLRKCILEVRATP